MSADSGDEAGEFEIQPSDKTSGSYLLKAIALIPEYESLDNATKHAVLEGLDGPVAKELKERINEEESLKGNIDFNEHIEDKKRENAALISNIANAIKDKEAKVGDNITNLKMAELSERDLYYTLQALDGDKQTFSSYLRNQEFEVTDQQLDQHKYEIASLIYDMRANVHAKGEDYAYANLHEALNSHPIYQNLPENIKEVVHAQQFANIGKISSSLSYSLPSVASETPDPETAVLEARFAALKGEEKPQTEKKDRLDELREELEKVKTRTIMPPVLTESQFSKTVMESLNSSDFPQKAARAERLFNKLNQVYYQRIQDIQTNFKEQTNDYQQEWNEVVSNRDSSLTQGYSDDVKTIVENAKEHARYDLGQESKVFKVIEVGDGLKPIVKATGDEPFFVAMERKSTDAVDVLEFRNGVLVGIISSDKHDWSKGPHPDTQLSISFLRDTLAQKRGNEIVAVGIEEIEVPVNSPLQSDIIVPKPLHHPEVEPVKPAVSNQGVNEELNQMVQNLVENVEVMREELAHEKVKRKELKAQVKQLREGEIVAHGIEEQTIVSAVTKLQARQESVSSPLSSPRRSSSSPGHIRR